MYLANSIYAAHHSTVEVLSDMEYRAMVTRKEASDSLYNVMMIGGPSINKAMKKYCFQPGEQDRRATDGIICRSPIQFHNYSERMESQSYSIGSRNFSSESLIFTFPIAKRIDSATEIAMGVCIHANSIVGWLHLSRLAWPVVPPMVRAPFATYLPDYVVIDHTIWSIGFGSVLVAGYWDSQWRFDEHQAYIK